MKLITFLTLALILVAEAVYSQKKPENIKYDRFGNVKYIKFDGKNKTGDWDSPTSPDAFFENILGMKDQNKFISKNKIERKDGSYFEGYRQVYNGINVEGGIYILHFRNGKLEKANGHFVNVSGLDTSPKLTPEEASKSYATYRQLVDSIPLDFLHEIVISEIGELSGGDTVYKARLCYKIDFLSSSADNGETGYIDALTGKVLKTTIRDDNYSATGTFSTLYNGTQTASTQYYNSTYNLCDSSRGAVIHTWDLNNVYYDYYLSNRVEFTDGNNTWTEAEHSSNYDQMAQDIHWTMQEIYDYFYENHDSLESYDGNNHSIDAYVHCYIYTSSGYTKNNACYSQSFGGFFFGDGGSTVKPMAALDVVSHEYGHGITKSFTGLGNNYTEQRAMNEGFSDIWGAAVEHAVAPNKSCWKMGEEVINITGDDCLRNMEEPESSTAYQQIADTYNDDVYTNGDFYAKSGVMSHWFYLLSEGGSGTNDNGNSYSMCGLGIEDAANIVFEGQTGHFGSVENYSEARTAMVDASDDVFGANSDQSLLTKYAWYAVGVGSCPLTISGPSVICSSSVSFTVNNIPSVDTLTWSYSSNLRSVYGGSNYTALVANGTGSGWVEATIHTSYGQIVLPAKIIWIGVPPTPTFTWNGTYTIAPGESQRIDLLSATTGEATSWTWTPGSYWLSCQTTTYNTGVGYIGNEIYVDAGAPISTPPLQLPLYVRSNNTCGTSNQATATIIVDEESKSVKIDDGLNKTETTSSNNEVSIPDVKTQKQLLRLYPVKSGTLQIQQVPEGLGELILYSIDGKQLLKQKITCNETAISNLPSGILLFRFISSNGEYQTGKVMIE
jgi:bacillolysin